MAGQEYTGKDKIVQKMSRDGLTEREDNNYGEDQEDE